MAPSGQHDARRYTRALLNLDSTEYLLWYCRYKKKQLTFTAYIPSDVQNIDKS